MHTRKPNIFLPPRNKQVNSDPCTEVKSISITTVKRSKFWDRHQNQINFDPYTRTKSTPTPNLKPSQFQSLQTNSCSISHINHVNFDPNTTTKWFSTLNTKTKTIFIPAQISRKKFDSHTKTQVIPIQCLKEHHSWPSSYPNQFRSLHWNQVKFDLPRWNQVNFGNPHRTKLSSLLTLKPSYLRPAHENQVNSDPRTKKNNFDPRKKTKSIAMKKSFLTLASYPS